MGLKVPCADGKRSYECGEHAVPASSGSALLGRAGLVLGALALLLLLGQLPLALFEALGTLQNVM
jgi:hypothetical protein